VAEEPFRDLTPEQLRELIAQGLVPRLIEPQPFNAPQGYAYYARFHIWFINAGAALLALHVIAALFHHFVRRDGVLRSMWPLAGRR